MRAIQITNDSTYQSAVVSLSQDALDDFEVLIQISASTLNYKDALAVTGKGPVVRRFPLIPGIDLAGTVVESTDDRYACGDKVILNGWGLGEKYHGGLAEFARVKADWLVPLPDKMSFVHAMSIGTAGYTSMLCVNALQSAGVLPHSGPIAVTGASGGVGSIAIGLLARRGYTVTAITGKIEEEAFLLKLGASEVLDRAAFCAPGKPLQKENFAGAVDVSGSHTLANLCAQMQYGGVVSACGLAQGMDFPSSVAPFILRGVSLIGIDSVYQPYQNRLRAWQALAEETTESRLLAATTTIGLPEVNDACQRIVAGKVTGRFLVDPSR
ncbi:oxidoreductase [Alteromonas sediminis]|uniref:Oxidoreductase n=1 Tax=Alteromonas sediminis TaxID=2259342 RepID=A0A3N5Y3V9_9ALTE|nr:MDR family oxidoreductase [Alteromonas sediminis]RPJ68787.1 oxidoreductase [Alteromonas sediminis]